MIDAFWQGALLFAALLALSIIDMASLRLPDPLTLGLLVTGLTLASLSGGIWALVTAALAAAAAFASFAGLAIIYRRLRGVNGLGLGDAKLLAAAGAWLGLAWLAPLVLCSALLALTYLGLHRLSGATVKATTVIPFGPFLSVAFFALWLVKNSGAGANWLGA